MGHRVFDSRRHGFLELNKTEINQLAIFPAKRSAPEDLVWCLHLMLEHRFDLWQRARVSERVVGGQIPKTELKGFRVFFRGIKWLALAAENVCVQEFIPEFAMRIVFLAQLNKAGQPPT